MALQHAVLAALVEGESSGYDLAKRFDASVANYWMTTPQQLYRELERMAAQGLIRTRVVQQERRPNKRVHSLTDHGREVLHAFTATSPKPTTVRDELLVQVQALDVGDGPAVCAAIGESRKRAEAKLDRYLARRDRLLDGRSEQSYIEEAEHLGPYLTLLRGIAFEEENIRWADTALAMVDQRRRAAPLV